MSVEQELIEAADLVAADMSKNRQAYLTEIAKAVSNLDDVAFNKLTDDAAKWSNSAIRAIKAKKPLPDFPDVEEEPGLEEQLKAEPAKPAKPDRRKGQPPKKQEHPPITPPADEIGLNDFGVIIGSKNAAAVAMLTRGCRMADVTETIGGTYYNLLRRLVKQGHAVESGANGMLKLVHKSKSVK